MIKRKEYSAKSLQEYGHQPAVQEYLRKVADLAKDFGARFNCSNEAWLAIRIVGGWVPDLMFPGEGHFLREE